MRASKLRLPEGSQSLRFGALAVAFIAAEAMAAAGETCGACGGLGKGVGMVGMVGIVAAFALKRTLILRRKASEIGACAHLGNTRRCFLFLSALGVCAFRHENL